MLSQEGAGIVVSDQNELKGERGLGLLTEAIKDDQMERLKGNNYTCTFLTTMLQTMKSHIC
jgi:glutamine phosphoribosylpyrophosphate amidotransferase